MHLRTEPVRLLAFGHWSDADEPDKDRRIEWRSGARVETITVLEEGGDQPRKMTLAEGVDVNGRPDVMAMVSLDVEIVRETRPGRNGGTYEKDKWKCHALHVVDAAKLKAA